MLAVAAAANARLDPGSLGLALARRWSEAGERVLFIDADASGARLAPRLGKATHSEYSPARRGLPSLMVARQPLTLPLLAEHCYSLDTARGSLWALFAPRHPDGAALASRWLADRADHLGALSAERRVIVSGLLGGGTRFAPLLAAAPVVAALSPVESTDQAKALWTVCRDAGLMGFGRGQRVVVVEGESPLRDDHIAVEAGMQVAGRLPVIDDERLLRLGGRRDRGLIDTLDEIAKRLLALWRLAAAENLEAAASRLPAADADPFTAGLFAPDAGPPEAADHVRRRQADGRAGLAEAAADPAPGPAVDGGRPGEPDPRRAPAPESRRRRG